MLLLNDILFFPIITSVEDEIGQVEENEEYSRMVFCEKKSVNRNEFFQAGQSGLKPSCLFVIHTLDYQEESNLKYKDKIYTIYRTYERPDELIELYCEVKLGVN